MGSVFKLKDENGNVLDVMTIRGPSAYDLAVKNGFEGSVNDWLQTFKTVVAGGIDDEMSDTSDNLVPNKVIKAYIDKLYLRSTRDSLTPLTLKNEMDITQDEFESVFIFYLSEDEIGIDSYEDIRRIIIKRVKGNTSDVTKFTTSSDIAKNIDGNYTLTYVNVNVSSALTGCYQRTFDVNSGSTPIATFNYNPSNRSIYIRMSTADIRLYNDASDFSVECYH
jgi:hypothetical protein